MKKHINSIHTKEKTYNCEHCEKVFSLRRHVQRKHLGKVFKCDDCGKVYSDKAPLLKHMKAVHLNITFDCDQCDKSFSFAGSLYI